MSISPCKKKLFISVFVRAEFQTVVGITITRPAILASNSFPIVCHRVTSQVSMEANGLNKKKWPHAALHDSAS